MQLPVRQSAVNFLGALRIFVGPSLLSLFDDEKPALVTTIKEKFAEVSLDLPMIEEIIASAIVVRHDSHHVWFYRLSRKSLPGQPNSSVMSLQQ
jgi:hypothetical protein